MKLPTLILGFIFSMSAFSSMDARSIRRSVSYGEARKNGAMAAIRLDVTDENADAVSNALVKASFDMVTFENNTSEPTNEKGVCLIENRTRGNAIEISVTKEGYYPSKKKLCLADMELPHAVNEGKWQPFPIQVPLTLKKISRPISSRSFGGCYYLPATNRWFAFDLAANDWLEPDGKGKVPDVEFSFDWTGEDPVKWKERGIVIRFPGNPCNGGYLVSTQAESKFPYSYKADPRQSYSKEFYDSATKESRKFGMLDGSKDFVFRFRSVTNEIGELTTCHYGRFRRIDYGHERTGQGVVMMRYDYNETPRDTNLEFIPTSDTRRVP